MQLYIAIVMKMMNIFDGGKWQLQIATPCYDNGDNTVASGNHDAFQAAVVSPNKTGSSIPQLKKGMKLNDTMQYTGHN